MSNNYKLQKVTPKDINITLTSLFGREEALLIGIRPAYVYVNNKPTDTIDAYYYDISHNGRYIGVKIQGEKQLDESLLPEGGLLVKFSNLAFKIYSSNNYPCICASADKITIL